MDEDQSSTTMHDTYVQFINAAFWVNLCVIACKAFQPDFIMVIVLYWDYIKEMEASKAQKEIMVLARVYHTYIIC